MNSDKKTKVIHIRFSELEYEELQKRADSALRNLSEYVRKYLFAKKYKINVNENNQK